MAIVKMKKLWLMAARPQKEALLRDLARLGCVEFSELSEEEAFAAPDSRFHRESSALLTYKNQQAALARALSVLDQYAAEKKPLLSAKAELDSGVLLSESGVESALSLADKLISRDERIKKIGAEESRQRSRLESLRPWLSLDLPLGMERTESCALTAGTVSARIDPNALDAALEGAVEEAELFRVSEDKSQRYLLLLCLREDTATALEALRPFGFTQVSFGAERRSAREETADAERALAALAAEKQRCAADITAAAPERAALTLAYDRVGAQISVASAEEKLYGSENVLFMKGWVPAEKEEALAGVLEGYDCAWECSTPTEEEYPEVPVQLKNNRVTNALNMVTNMYSLPAYGTVDPNPLMAPFFILFYGLMMADMAYGVIMVAAALVALKKIRPREGTLSFCQLLLYGGISTFVMGALTGSCFGDAPYQLVHILHPDSTWEGLPYLFSPVNDSEMVLYGALALGLIQLNVGMVVNFVRRVKTGHTADAVWEEGSLWVILAGAVLMILGKGNVAGLPVVLLVGVVMLLFGAGRNARGFGKVTAAFSAVYNEATGWFGDVLSYSRIMALMLAGGVVAQVFNTIAVMPLQSGINVLTVFFSVFIFLLGHALNFGLNLLSCFVHDLRLQCLEYFGKFYVDGGRPFAPLRLRPHYVQAKEE